MKMRAIFGFLSIVLPSVQAQTPSEFDVTLIRPHPGGDQEYRIRTPPGSRFTATNVTVRTLILQAFDIKDFQLAGTPGWLDAERYDIDAKVDVPGASQNVISPEELMPLVRALLASRFKLMFHRETKELAAYALVAPKNGPKLRPNTGTPAHSTDWGKGHINATDVTVTEFGRLLETQLDRVVVDETGIPGAFDFKLTWSPDESTDSTGPSIFTAIQELYRLKLESKKSSVGILVIDHVERPTDN